jgi:hypothetical protein
MTTSARSGRLLALILIVVGLIGTFAPAAAQDAGTPGAPEASAVDLARVPLSPDALPEGGYQLAQAGDLELNGLQYAWSGDGLDMVAWEPIATSYRHGFSSVLVLLSDRGDPFSEPLASVTTIVVGLDGEDAAADAVPALLEMKGYEPTEDIDGVTAYNDRNGVLGAIAVGDYVVLVQYATAVTDGPGQNTGDWTPEAVAELTLDTVDLLEDAIADAEDGESALGVANVMFTGPDASWTLPWNFFPNTEHYRVLDGKVMPYGGELSGVVRDALPEGAIDLFVSRQQVGDEEYNHLIDVTLARFESESDAAAFSDDPAPITFPPTWEFDVEYGSPEDIDGVRLEQASADGDALRASGWRSVRQDGELVQVVQWLGSGNAQVTEDAVRWLTDLQLACLDALPEPCATVPQEEIPVAIDAESAATQPGDGSTPETGGDGMVLASDQFGWRVDVPVDDGWTIADVQIIGASEYYQLQSGRSLVTIESAPDQHGDSQQCVLDNMRLLEQLEERAVIEFGSDDPDERPAGIEQDHGWAIYTVEPLQDERADQEYTIRIDCYTLVEGQASLVVTHTAPRDLWTEERDKGERFREAIELPDASSTTTADTPLAGDRRHIGRTITMGIPRIWISPAA